jgi:ATP/ADP translocase
MLNVDKFLPASFLIFIVSFIIVAMITIVDMLVIPSSIMRVLLFIMSVSLSATMYLQIKVAIKEIWFS